MYSYLLPVYIMNISLQLEESSMTRNKVLEGNSMDGRQERGFLSGQIKRQENKTARSVAPAGIEVEVDPALQVCIFKTQIFIVQ